ncbi:MAG: hypothetical protein JXP34_15925 [Planctomycetes bacterium]|nr:hypothetical protein [Planctomycetota bacterium]
MGIGIVLLFWGFAGLIAAALAAVFLAEIARRLPAPDEPTRSARVKAARVIPFALLLYGGLFFLAYAAWCDVVRGVDAGIGDFWCVPLGEGYRLEIIDDPSTGSIRRGEDPGVIEPQGKASARFVNAVTELGQSASVLFGIRERGKAFLLDTARELREDFATRDDLVRALRERGVEPHIASVDRFYMRRRWGRPDAAAAGVGAVPAILLLVRLWRKTLRGPRSRAA